MTVFSSLCFWCQMIVYTVSGGGLWLLSPAPLWFKALCTGILLLALVGSVNRLVDLSDRGAK